MAALFSRVTKGLITLLLAFVALIAGMAFNAASASSSPTSTQWWGYHGGASGTGATFAITSFRTNSARWTSHVLDGQLYGEPLVVQGEIIVATQNDSVYALSAGSGSILWRRHLATPVPASMLPCGNISPEVGITGTPVIDPLRHEVFALAFEVRAGRAVHYLYGLDERTGALRLAEEIPTPTRDQRPYLNRSGLALSHGRVIYTFGGNFGDCGEYHGVIGAVSEMRKSHPLSFVIDSSPGQREGAVWMGGAAPAIDAAGNVWVTSGNGSATNPQQRYDHSDGVLELSATMHLMSYFAPANWWADNAADVDLASEPALLGHGLVVATGKSGYVYVLRTANLGGIGHEIAAIDSHCGNVLVGGVAIVGSVVYLPCQSGTEALGVSTNPVRLSILWHSAAGSGPPIVAGSRVWSIAGGVLYGLNLHRGAVMQRANLGEEVNHFATPAVGDGLLIAPRARSVIAFAGV